MSYPKHEIELALIEATRIATWLWENFYKDVAPQWKALPDLRGVLSQIDNMCVGLKDDLPVYEWVNLPDKHPPLYDNYGSLLDPSGLSIGKYWASELKRVNT